MQKHDSQYEASLPYLKYDQAFSIPFYDKQGTEFNAKPDALFLDDKGIITFVEFKCSPLNSKTSISSSHKALLVQANWRGVSSDGDHNRVSASLWNSGYRKDCLDSGWNHSTTKHAIVSASLKKQGYRYIVVFRSHPPYVGKKNAPFKLYYGNKGVETLLQSEFDVLAMGWDNLEAIPVYH